MGHGAKRSAGRGEEVMPEGRSEKHGAERGGRGEEDRGRGAVVGQLVVFESSELEVESTLPLIRSPHRCMLIPVLYTQHAAD